MLKFSLILSFFYVSSLLAVFAQTDDCHKTFEASSIKIISGFHYDNALIVGSGSFGTGMSFVLAHNFKGAWLGTRNTEVLNSVNRSPHVNDSYLSLPLPKNVKAILLDSQNPNSNLHKISWDLVVFATPLSSLDSVLKEHHSFFSALVKKGIPFVSLAKGIETDSLRLSDDIFLDLWPELKKNLMFLSGPSFAMEIAEKKLTFLTLAGASRMNLLRVHHMLSTPELKIQMTKDIKGVLIGGAVKNVIAIAMGIAEGLGVGANTKAGLMSLLLEEAVKLGRYYKAVQKTSYGFSGLGDSILSSEGTTSRNKKFGLIIGSKSQKPQEFMKKSGKTVEGYYTVFPLHQVIESKRLELPLFQALFSILYEESRPNLLIEQLREYEMIFDESLY